jgi:hypothetical protein
VKWLDDLEALPPGTLARRAGLAALLAIGVTMTAMGSMFWSLTGPIPLKLIPDLRPLLTLGSGLFLGLYAAGGGAHRRKFALWGVIGYLIAFHLEEATVHWIGPFPGSITGTRVGILGTLGSLTALAAVLLMHVEVEHARLARDLRERGADGGDARAAAGALRGVGTTRILGIAAGTAAIGALVRIGEAIFGNDAAGGVYALFLGAALLLGLSFVLLRFVPKRA